MGCCNSKTASEDHQGQYVEMNGNESANKGSKTDTGKTHYEQIDM